MTPASTPPRRSVRWRWLMLLAAAIALFGELGHAYLSRIGDSLAHHAFHAATVIVASVLFWLLVASDINHHGVPPRLRGRQRECRSRGPQGWGPRRPGTQGRWPRARRASARCIASQHRRFPDR